MRRYRAIVRFPADDVDKETEISFVIFASGWARAVYRALEEMNKTTISGRLHSITED